MKLFNPIAVLLIALSFMTQVDAADVVQWSGDPIAIELAVGQERRIDWPAPVKIGIPESLRGVVRIQSVGNATHWMAARAFDAQRAMITEIETGTTYLVDVSAQRNSELRSASQIIIAANATQDDLSAPSLPSGSHGVEKYVRLIRLAAREYLAPARLREGGAIYTRLPVVVETHPILSGTADLEVTPLGAWRRDGLFVTTVEFSNPQ